MHRPDLNSGVKQKSAGIKRSKRMGTQNEQQGGGGVGVRGAGSKVAFSCCEKPRSFPTSYWPVTVVSLDIKATFFC